MTTITIHDQSYELYSWQDFGDHVFALSKNIIESGESFERIIALAKGGTSIVRPIADLCNIKELSSIQIEFYTGIAETTKTPVITQSLPVKIKDERILIIDDIADSGETLMLATNYVKQHGASDIKTVTLVTKPWTKFKPDFSYYQTEAWIIFPWEDRETIQLLAAIWQEKGDREAQIKAQLKQIGYGEEAINLFLNS